jgi:hypothetical protein
LELEEKHVLRVDVLVYELEIGTLIRIGTADEYALIC